jgi:hypothetical protein
MSCFLIPVQQTVNVNQWHRGFDGFLKSPNSLLRFILRFFMVRKVQIITQDLRASNLKLFSLPSKSDFLPLHQFCFIPKRCQVRQFCPPTPAT